MIICNRLICLKELHIGLCSYRRVLSLNWTLEPSSQCHAVVYCFIETQIRISNPKTYRNQSLANCTIPAWQHPFFSFTCNYLCILGEQYWSLKYFTFRGIPKSMDVSLSMYDTLKCHRSTDMPLNCHCRRTVQPLTGFLSIAYLGCMLYTSRNSPAYCFFIRINILFEWHALKKPDHGEKPSFCTCIPSVHVAIAY